MYLGFWPLRNKNERERAESRRQASKFLISFASYNERDLFVRVCVCMDHVASRIDGRTEPTLLTPIIKQFVCVVHATTSKPAPASAQPVNRPLMFRSLGSRGGDWSLFLWIRINPLNPKDKNFLRFFPFLYIFQTEQQTTSIWHMTNPLFIHSVHPYRRLGMRKF